MAVLFVLHVVIAILLVVSILMQSGKGGGLAEGFASAENLLGARTNTVMVRISAVLAAMFLGMSLLLAVLSSDKERSLVADLPDTPKVQVVNVEKLFDQPPAQTIEINAAPAAAEMIESVLVNTTEAR